MAKGKSLPAIPATVHAIAANLLNDLGPEVGAETLGWSRKVVPFGPSLGGATSRPRLGDPQGAHRPCPDWARAR